MRNKRLYPANWKDLSAQCRERAGYQCENCGISQGDTRVSRKGNEYVVYLQAAHKNHSERHMEKADLVCLCSICHWWYDFEHSRQEAERKLFRLKVAQVKKRRKLI